TVFLSVRINRTRTGVLMSSDKQLLANRQNALKSTGPKSLDGKSRSAQNALKHGLCSQAVLPTEDRLSFDMFCDEMRDSLHPCSPAESTLVERITQLSWRIQRLPDAEAEIYCQLDLRHDAPHPLSSSELLAHSFIYQDDRT